MNSFDNENETPSEDEIIEEFLDEKPRARELRLMRFALEQRRTMIKKDYERITDEREQAQVQHKIRELDKQIAALRQEETITDFVGNSVRVTLSKSSLDEME